MGNITERTGAGERHGHLDGIRRVPGGRPARGHGEPDGHPDPEQGQEGYGCGHTGRARGKNTAPC